MGNKVRESNQIVQGINKTNYSFQQRKSTDSALFKDIFQQNFKVQKSFFMKYVIVI